MTLNRKTSAFHFRIAAMVTATLLSTACGGSGAPGGDAGTRPPPGTATTADEPKRPHDLKVSLEYQ